MGRALTTSPVREIGGRVVAMGYLVPDEEQP